MNDADDVSNVQRFGRDQAADGAGGRLSDQRRDGVPRRRGAGHHAAGPAAAIAEAPSPNRRPADATGTLAEGYERAFGGAKRG